MRPNYLILLLLFSTSACGQRIADEPIRVDASKAKVGGPCEGCEFIYEYGDRPLNWVDTLPDFRTDGPSLVIDGAIYQADGETPAPGVVLYIYHTDQNGRYPKPDNPTAGEKRHGYIRGWVKTNEQGAYRFYTQKPASYPNSRIPAHIHMTIKEPGMNEYYIDSIEFDDDPYLTEKQRNNKNPRGGSGIVRLSKNAEGYFYGQRDIILGMNIDNYE